MRWLRGVRGMACEAGAYVRPRHEQRFPDEQRFPSCSAAPSNTRVACVRGGAYAWRHTACLRGGMRWLRAASVAWCARQERPSVLGTCSSVFGLVSLGAVIVILRGRYGTERLWLWRGGLRRERSPCCECEAWRRRWHALEGVQGRRQLSRALSSCRRLRARGGQLHGSCCGRLVRRLFDGGDGAVETCAARTGVADGRAASASVSPA